MLGLVYGWKPGARIGLKAQVVGERLEHLRQKHGGLDAVLVVEDARPPGAPTHEAFEWDDARAAEQYREDQARYLIRSVTVQQTGEEKPSVRAFVVVNETGAEQTYTSVYVALADEQLRKQVLARALRELQQWEARYQELAELAEVLSAARAARERLAS